MKNLKVWLTKIIKKSVYYLWLPDIIFRKTIYNIETFKKPVFNSNDGSSYLFELILNCRKRPFLAGKMGNIEAAATLFTDYKKRHCLFIPQAFDYYNFLIRYEHLWQNAGMFSLDKKGLRTFHSYITESLKNVDYLGTWPPGISHEHYLVNKYTKDEVFLSTLESFYVFSISFYWSMALKGLKVLVISPFDQSIQQQYKKRKYLFANKDVLPDFDLITYKSINTIKGEQCDFPSWETALLTMFDDIKTIDFDIALIGAGSYSLPLGYLIKTKLNKSAIHLGGATQILFGVKGKRWDNEPNLYNKYWVRPNEKEKPKNADLVENGCYW